MREHQEIMRKCGKCKHGSTDPYKCKNSNNNTFEFDASKGKVEVESRCCDIFKTCKNGKAEFKRPTIGHVKCSSCKHFFETGTTGIWYHHHCMAPIFEDPLKATYDREVDRAYKRVGPTDGTPIGSCNCRDINDSGKCDYYKEGKNNSKKKGFWGRIFG